VPLYGLDVVEAACRKALEMGDLPEAGAQLRL
jgi:hypothetical protein